MKICLCTWDTPDYADLAAVSMPGKEEYCKRHGYKFEHCVTEKDDPHLGFERMDVVRNLLPSYDLVLSVDTDAMIMNHTIRADWLRSPMLAISEDLLGLNDGVFAMTNTPLAHQFMAVYMSMRQQGNSQQVLAHLLNMDLYGSATVKPPQKAMNAYRNELYGRPDWFTGNYEPGDWICQWPGMTKEARIPLMLEAQKDVIR